MMSYPDENKELSDNAQTLVRLHRLLTTYILEKNDQGADKIREMIDSLMHSNALQLPVEVYKENVGCIKVISSQQQKKISNHKRAFSKKPRTWTRYASTSPSTTTLTVEANISRE